MKNFARYGCIQFGLALIAFGIQHFMVREFTIGEPRPWSPSITWGFLWAYLSGLLLIFTGAMLLFNKNAAPFLMITGIMIFLWGFVRDLPPFFTHPVFDASVTRMGEALAMTGSCFIIASFLNLSNTYSGGSFVLWIKKLMPVGPVFIGIFLIICGTQHFTLTKFVQTLVPAWIRYSLFFTYVAGVALIMAGIGLMLPRMRKIAAFWSGLMIFIWMLILHSPRVARNIHDTDEWISLLETIAFSAALFVLAFSKKKEGASASDSPN